MQTCARFVKIHVIKTFCEHLKLTHQAQGMVSQCRTKISHANTPCAKGSALTFFCVSAIGITTGGHAKFQEKKRTSCLWIEFSLSCAKGLVNLSRKIIYLVTKFDSAPKQFTMDLQSQKLNLLVAGRHNDRRLDTSSGPGWTLVVTGGSRG